MAQCSHCLRRACAPRTPPPPPPNPPPPPPHAKVASNYVKTSSSSLNPLSQAINAGKIIWDIAERKSPKEPDELWWLRKLFQRESWTLFRTFSVHFPQLFKAWDWMLHYGGFPARFNPDGKSQYCFNPSDVWKVHRYLSLSAASFHLHILISIKVVDQSDPQRKFFYKRLKKAQKCLQIKLSTARIY